MKNENKKQKLENFIEGVKLQIYGDGSHIM